MLESLRVWRSMPSRKSGLVAEVQRNILTASAKGSSWSKSAAICSGRRWAGSKLPREFRHKYGCSSDLWSHARRHWQGSDATVRPRVRRHLLHMRPGPQPCCATRGTRHLPHSSKRPEPHGCIRELRRHSRRIAQSSVTSGWSWGFRIRRRLPWHGRLVEQVEIKISQINQVICGRALLGLIGDPLGNGGANPAWASRTDDDGKF